MIYNLPKRKRKILLSSVLTLLFSMVIVTLVWDTEGMGQYLPGQQVEGVTSRLSRDLPTDVPAVRFERMNDRAGIKFTHYNHKRNSRLAEDMGSGIAWVDYDNDGFQDLFIVNYSGPFDMTESELEESSSTSKLYRNNGDGTFRDVSKPAGLDIRTRGMATAWADYNNDGYIDCLLTTYGENMLFKNNGDGTFTDVSEPSGLSGMAGFWAGAAWGDFNQSGYADLYITGYVSYFDIASLKDVARNQEPPSLNPSVFEPIRNLLYVNNGDGTFTEVAEKARVDNPDGKSLEVAWIDITNDNLPDLYVANDVSDNRLYLNMGDGTFTDISYSTKVADYRGSMGMAFGDWNGDEDMDLFLTHWIAEENALYNSLQNDNDSDGMIFFSDDADRFGLGQSSLKKVGWATSFFDFDNDGRLDLFVVNGHTNQVRENPDELVGMTDLLYWNRNNDEGFYEISSIAGDYFQEEYVGRGGAYADFNNDGKLDLFILNHNGPGILLENQTINDHHWLQVELTGTESNRSAIGAKLRLVTTDGVQIRQVGSQSSYLSQNSLVQHFGLKQAAVVDTLEILWPSGKTQVFNGLEADRHLQITEGSMKIVP